MEYNCALIKVDWLSACIAKTGWLCICQFPSTLAYNLQSPPVNGKQEMIPEEMSHAPPADQ